MALLGISKIIPARQAVAGKFYMHEMYGSEEPGIFLCFLTGQEVEGNPEMKAAYFNSTSEHKMQVHSMPYSDTLVELPEVHVRVDAPTLSAAKSSSNIRAGMMVVEGDRPLAAIHVGFRHWHLIDLSTGRAVPNGIKGEWASFSRWQLVIEDNGDEIPIISFGEDVDVE